MILVSNKSLSYPELTASQTIAPLSRAFVPLPLVISHLLSPGFSWGCSGFSILSPLHLPDEVRGT